MKVCNFFYKELSAGILQVEGFFPKDYVGLQTGREGGASEPPYDCFNLATHVGDSPSSVAKNRARLAGFLPSEPAWLDQVHGCEVAVIASREAARQSKADASITGEPDLVCAVMTADCLPLLVARPSTGQSAAIHAGWRGLAAGVIEGTLEKMMELGGSPRACGPRDDFFVWLGPAIGQGAFEVGPEVHEIFVQHSPSSAAAFSPSPSRQGHFMASLHELALLRLKTFESVTRGCEFRVAVDHDCVFTNPKRFFSYRRNPTTGRMASLIFRRIDQKA